MYVKTNSKYTQNYFKILMQNVKALKWHIHYLFIYNVYAQKFGISMIFNVL